MSKRTITRDPVIERQKAYRQLVQSKEGQEALWDALELLSTNGIDIGSKACKVLEKRSEIKRSIPK